MNREQRERLVDGALARALTPKKVSPRDGFEQRLLTNLAAQPERRPWWRWMWVSALVAAAVIAIIFGTQAMDRRVSPVIETRQQPPHAVQQATVAANVRPTLPARVVRRRVARQDRPHVQVASANLPSANLPKQDVFPTPLPPTEQERKLLALVHRRPQLAQDIAAQQEADRQAIRKYLESGFTPGEAGNAQQMR